MADTKERIEQDGRLIAALIEQINAATPALTGDQAQELARALLAVGPRKRRRLLIALLQATKGNIIAKAAVRDRIPASMFCQHDYPVGRCPICAALGLA